MRSITVFLSFFLLITLAFCRRTSADLKDEQGPSNYFIRAPVEYIVPDANNQAAVNYALPSSDYTTYNVPLTYYYQNPSGVYWPPLNNVPNANIPTIYQVPFGNVPTYCPYPYPCVPNNTPIGGIPSVPNVPNGIYPTARPVTPRPAYPQSPPRGYTPKPESDDENLGRREPLQPGSDGVMDPEVGLSREKLVKYGPTMFGGTFDLDNMRFDGFSSWMKLLSASAKPWWKGSVETNP